MSISCCASGCLAAGPAANLEHVGAHRLEIDLHNAAPGEVDVSAHGDELLVRVRDFQRRISLPASVAGRPVATVSLEKGVLAVTFQGR